MPVEARFSAPVQTEPGAHPASCTMSTGFFPGGKELPVRVANPSTSSSAVVKKRIELYLCSPYGPYSLYIASVPVQYSYTSTPSVGRTACTEPQCLYSTAIPLLPLWAVRPETEPQCLYSTAIPLLPLWAVRPVQSLSACTEPQCLYSTAIPLLPLWAVPPVQSLSACTVQLYLYSPYGPYNLYSLSACTTVHFTFFYPQNNWEPALLFIHSAFKFHNIFLNKNNLFLTSQVLFVYLHNRNISDTKVWLSRFIVLLFLYFVENSESITDNIQGRVFPEFCQINNRVWTFEAQCLLPVPPHFILKISYIFFTECIFVFHVIHLSSQNRQYFCSQN